MPRVTIGDVSLHVTERGHGRPLLLVHGFPLDHTMWMPQVAGLSGRCRIIAPDLRGFGESDVTAGAVTMAQYADDLAGLLDALAISEPVIFCGLSMGGYIGWQFWARHRKRLAMLIACDTRAVADSPEAAAGRLKTAERVLAEGPQVMADGMLPKLFSREHLEQNAPFVAQTRDVILGTNPEGIAAALRGMAERPDFTSQLGGIAVKTLVLCGEQDGIATPQEMRQIAAGIPGAEFVEIAGAAHMAPLESPQAVTEAIVRFVG